MSYYGEKKADDILNEVIQSELTEFSGGRKVTSPNMAKFVARRLLNGLVPIGVGALFGLLFVNIVAGIIVGAIFEICTLISFFSGDKLTALIAAEAKKAPDKKISTIIAENCVVDENGPVVFLETKKKKSPVIPIVITLCSILAAFILVGVIYLFVPITLYSETEEGYAVSLCRAGITQSVTVESVRNGKPVVGIKSGAFKNNFFLKNVELPDSITFIEGEAFMNCLFLDGVTIPPKVTEIRGDTFRNCKSLRDVRLHDNITYLHAGCFMGCESLYEITLPHGITEIHANTFDSCYSLQRIDIPEGVTRIAARAFYDCDHLTDVTIPQTVTEIGSSAFRDCDRLDRIVISSGCSVNERAFKDSPTEIYYY